MGWTLSGWETGYERKTESGELGPVDARRRADASRFRGLRVRGLRRARGARSNRSDETERARQRSNDLEIALRARRSTAAAFATGYALLFLTIVLVPYRKGEVWAWWALLIGTLATTGIILLRVSVLGTHLGLAAVTFPLALGVVALLLDAGRLKAET